MTDVSAGSSDRLELEAEMAAAESIDDGISVSDGAGAKTLVSPRADAPVCAGIDVSAGGTLDGTGLSHQLQ
jgi:hypothetical protein